MADAKKLVMLMEDDPAARDALGLLLADWGYDPLAAPDAAVAAAKLAGAQKPLFAVVTDFNLGRGPDGVAAALTLIAQHPAARVLVVSGSMRGKAAVEAKAAGFDYLSKPVRPEAIENWLDSLAP
ncbi:MAG: response regulator [Hyphomonadaceae bacterium]